MVEYTVVLGSGSQLLSISTDEQTTIDQINDQARLARELSKINGIIMITFKPSKIILRKAIISEWVDLMPQITPLIEAFYAPTIPSTQLER